MGKLIFALPVRIKGEAEAAYNARVAASLTPVLIQQQYLALLGRQAAAVCVRRQRRAVRPDPRHEPLARSRRFTRG